VKAASDFVMQQAIYLPDHTLLGQRNATNTVVDTLAKNLVSQLLSPSRCSDQVHFIWAPPGGTGAKLSALIKPLQWCLRHNCHLRLPDLPFYAHNCSVHDFSCFFKQISNCSAFRPNCKEKQYDKHRDHIRRYHSLMSVQPFNGPGPDHGYCRWAQPNALKYMPMRNSYMKTGSRVLPKLYRKQGLFWLVSHLTAFIMRPNTRLAAEIEATKQRLGWRQQQQHGGIMGVHIRHGDSCGHDGTRTARTCSQLANYMHHARRVRKQYGIRSIFIASDSAAVIRQAKKDYGHEVGTV
jgi:hypothetical protein